MCADSWCGSLVQHHHLACEALTLHLLSALVAMQDLIMAVHQWMSIDRFLRSSLAVAVSLGGWTPFQPIRSAKKASPTQGALSPLVLMCLAYSSQPWNSNSSHYLSVPSAIFSLVSLAFFFPFFVDSIPRHLHLPRAFTSETFESPWSSKTKTPCFSLLWCTLVY